MKKKKREYTGVLAEPLPWSADGKIEAVKVRERALLDWYGIKGGVRDPETGWKLARALAHDHVPGFQLMPLMPPPPRRRGRPLDPRVGMKHWILWLTGAIARSQGGEASERAAVLELGKSWRESGCSKYSDDSFWRRYQLLMQKIRTSGLPPSMKQVEDEARQWLMGLMDG